MWHGDGGGGGGVGDGMSGSNYGGASGGGVGGSGDEWEGKGKGEKTLIQDEYNEGKELCKEIKKKKNAERERSFKSTCLRLRSLATVVVLFLSWRAVVLAITPSPVIKNSMTTACGILKNVQ
ncbi:hypothetical protein QTP88_018354 [Uroleucon formosanum]